MKVSGKLHAPTALAAVPIPLKAGWAPEPVRMVWRENLFFLLEDWATLVQQE